MTEAQAQGLLFTVNSTGDAGDTAPGNNGSGLRLIVRITVREPKGGAIVNWRFVRPWVPCAVN